MNFESLKRDGALDENSERSKIFHADLIISRREKKRSVQWQWYFPKINTLKRSFLLDTSRWFHKRQSMDFQGSVHTRPCKNLKELRFFRFDSSLRSLTERVWHRLSCFTRVVRFITKQFWFQRLNSDEKKNQTMTRSCSFYAWTSIFFLIVSDELSCGDEKGIVLLNQ